MNNPDLRMLRDLINDMKLSVNLAEEAIDALHRVDKKIIKLRAQNTAFMISGGGTVQVNVYQDGVSKEIV